MKRVPFILAGTAVILAAILAATTNAGAEGNGWGRGGGDLAVAPDGTIVVVHSIRDSATTEPEGKEIAAISASGDILWRQEIGCGLHDLALLGSLVVAAHSTCEGSPGTPTGSAPTTDLRALRLANGAEAWSLSLPGVVADLTPAGGRIYLRTMSSAQTTSPTPSPTPGRHRVIGGPRHGGANGGGGGNVSISAVDENGELLWTRLF